MALYENQDTDPARFRKLRLSKGHNPPRHVDDQLPTFPVGIAAGGGPGKTAQGAKGSNPWILGSFTLGSNQVWLPTHYDFNASSPNVWFKLRHNHPGTAATPGGTIDEWFLASRGRLADRTGPEGFYPVRGPGTIFLYGFGAGSVSGTSSNLVHRALGTRGVDRFSGKISGYIA